MIGTRCAICDSDGPATELYPATLPDDAATFDRFSARRTPDRVHYRLVRCDACGLLRSDPILPDEELARLYEGSILTYQSEADYAARTYSDYLTRCLPLLPGKGRLLEIGCGDGFFLRRAIDLGFDAYGVEPSRQAVESAAPDLRSRIHIGTFQPGLYPEGHFDIVCAFQVFDHMAHPGEVLDTCRRILRKGGLALFINHDTGAWTNRLLGERSPIIDIEHIYLYNRQTMRSIFTRHGFEVLQVFAVQNRYPLHYWLKMAPLPRLLKERLLERLRGSAFGQISVSLRAGNLGLIARSPQV